MASEKDIYKCQDVSAGTEVLAAGSGTHKEETELAARRVLLLARGR